MADILVIGASGTVGAETARELLARGAKVRLAGSDPEALTRRFGPETETVRFDFLDPATWTAAFTGIRAVFLMRPPQIGDTRRHLLPALAAAQAAGVRQVTFLSLIGIENLTMVPHWPVEQFLKASGMDWCFLRCSFFMQNLAADLRAGIRDRGEIAVPVGNAGTAFIDTRDIGAIAALTLTEPGHAGKAYDLTGPAALSYAEVAAILSRELGRPIRYHSPHPAAFFLRQLAAHRSPGYALVTAWLYGNTRRGMAEPVTGEVRRLLGRDPITLERYVAEHRSVWQP